MDRTGEGTKFTLDRKIFSSDIWFASPWKLKIWIYLIGNANHADGEFMGIPIERGQLIRSYRTIAKECGYKIGWRLKKPSHDTVRRVCEELMKEKRTVHSTVHCGTLFTILNYNELQLNPKARTVQGTRGASYSSRTTHVQNNKNNKNNKNKELKKYHPFGLPSKEILNDASLKKINSDIETLCEKLYQENIFAKVHAFKNQMLKKNKNERAVLHALSRCYMKRVFDKSDAWGYCLKIMQVEDGNYNEREYQKTT